MLRIARDALVVSVLLSFLSCRTSSTGQVYGFAVSPDGKVLAVSFIKEKSFLIYRIPLVSGQASRLTHNATGEESGPAFSPDGRLIAYSYVPPGGHQQIVIMNVDGSNRYSAVESGTANLDVTFAPTGTTIYFARSYPPPDVHDWDIFSARLDGSDVRQLTRERFYRVSQPSIAPDGKSMVLLTEGLSTHQRITVYSLTQPATPPLVFQPHVPKEASGGPIFVNPQYLPDGRGILFMAASDGEHGFDYDIYRMEIATGILDRLTTGNGFASDLCVLPDGKTAIFQKWHSKWLGRRDIGQLYLLDLASRQVKPFAVTGLD